MSSKGASRVKQDTAEGVILGPGAATVFVEGKKWSLDNDSVAPHGDSPHNNPKTIASIETVVVEKTKPVLEDDRATCGHPITGSSTVFVGTGGGSAGDQQLDKRPGARIAVEKPSRETSPLPTPATSASPAGQEMPQDSQTIPDAVPTSGPTGPGADEMIKAMNRAGLTDACLRAQIMAQTAHESGNFTARTENLNYSASALQRVWPNRFNASNVQEYAGNPEKIANKTYGGRMGNGNEASGEGWKYRGRGFIQLTGKANYIAASRALGYDFVNNPDAAATDPHAANLAVWYCTKFRPLRAPCDVTASTRVINGGTNGLADRQSKFEAYKNDQSVITLDTNNV